MIEVINSIAWPLAAIVCALIIAATLLDRAEKSSDNFEEILERVALQARDIADLKRKVSKLNLLRGIVEE